MKAGESRAGELSTSDGDRSSGRYFPLKDLPQLRSSQQVAAVCYRIRKNEIEILLVHSSGGRWIFPKGGVEPGLTHAQSAALEAFEEGGVHGRIEKSSFTRYVHPKRRLVADSVGTVVNVHLCEVLRLDPPQESHRNPTWFSVSKAKRRLQQDRNADFGGILAQV